MSSPFRASDRSPSSQRSTPSRTLSNGLKRANGYHRSSRNLETTSPSQQLLEDFSRKLIVDDRAFRSSLNEQTAAQAKLHVDAIDRALAKHQQVRESAERTRERIELEAERVQREKDENERKAVEKARRDLEEQRLAEERRRLDEENARAAERQKQEALKREQEEAKRNAEAQRQQAEEERARKEREDKEAAESKAKEETDARQRAQEAEAQKQKAQQQTSTATPQSNGLGTSQPISTPQTASQTVASDLPKGLVSTMDEREHLHRRYLDLHKRLKTMRKQVLAQAQQIPGFKNKLSDWRRSIQKCCGQLSKAATAEAKESNKRATIEITKQLDAAAQVGNPAINITDYLVQNQQPQGANPEGPAALLFLLNHFAKGIVAQFISESAVDPKSADTIGVLAVTIFARPQYLFNGQSLIDLLWAKYHKRCPALFGITGSENSNEGRQRLGWHIDNETNRFVLDQEHYDRMSGLGAGFAAITLRDFSKSKNSNPAPNRIYWEALARIINTPATDVQQTHFVLVKAMITNYVQRFISTFGGAGLAALRQALIFFPNEKGPSDDKGRKLPAVSALQAMPIVLQKELHLTL